MADKDDNGVSAEEAGDIARAAVAGTQDGDSGDYDPDDKLSSDTPDQKAAYDKAFNKAT
jgi:hypothetical protein